MKALVIGGTGYIGRGLCAELAVRGVEVVIALRAGQVDPGTAPDRRTVALALDDAAVVERVLDDEQPDIVVHLASGLIPASDAAAYFTERDRVINPTFALLHRLAEARIPIAFVSSGGAIYGPTGQALLTEESACRPISFYGQAKLEIEQFIRFLGRTAELPHLILRPSNPFGGSQTLGGRQGLVAAAIGAVRDAQQLRIWGDGQVIRDYIYIDDLCAAAAHLIARRATGIVNLGSGQGVSTLEVVRTVERIVGQAVAIKFAPGRSVDVPRVVLDCSRAKALEVPPPRPFADGVRQFAADIGLLHG